jgi:hypothetical protein
MHGYAPSPPVHVILHNNKSEGEAKRICYVPHRATDCYTAAVNANLIFAVNALSCLRCDDREGGVLSANCDG